MGIFSNKGMEKELARLERAVREHVEAGEQVFTVSVNLLANGMSSLSMDRMREASQQRLQAIGLNVKGVNVEDWTHTARFGVETSYATESRQSAPTSASPNRTASLTLDDPDELSKWLKSVLTEWSDPKELGRPFGPGFGLEVAISRIGAATFPPFFFQSVAQQVADVLIGKMRQTSLRFDDVDEALGIDAASLRKAGVKESSWEGLVQAVVQTKKITIGLASMDMNALEPWFASDALKTEVYVYHAVALGRLGIPY